MNAGFRWSHLCVCASLCVLAAGCGGIPELPETFDVATSATNRVTVEAGTGPASLASSEWSAARKADPSDAAQSANDAPPPGPYGGILDGDALPRPPAGERMFTVQFGPQGEILGVDENGYLLPDIYGPTIPVGSEWVATTLPGVSYRSASYGTQVGDRFGLAIVAQVRFLQVSLGQAVLYAWGTQTADTMNGQFGYLLDFTRGIVNSLGTIADQYPFEGERIAP